jgi:hypothetical protein
VPEPPDVVALYARPPTEFVAARDDLAKALRAAGDRQRAAEVAALRRPTTPAWALDLVARESPELVTRLLDAGGALRIATGRAMAGDASSLRAAEAGERSAVDAVIEVAVTGAAAAGVPVNDGHRHRMAATLRAAVLDDSVAAALTSGTLSTDHEAAPLGFDAGAPTLAVAARPAQRPPARRTTAEAQAHRAELDRLRQEADRLNKRASRLQGEAEEATRRSTELRAQAKDAARAARDAERRLGAAERRTRS